MDDKQAVQEIKVPFGGWPERYLTFMWGKFSPAEGFGEVPPVFLGPEPLLCQ